MNRLPREPEAFGEAIVREMIRLQPTRTIEFSGPLDVVADGHHLDLSHLYRMVWQQPKQGQHIVTQYLPSEVRKVIRAHLRNHLTGRGLRRVWG